MTNKSSTLNTLSITALTLAANATGLLLHIILASNLGASRELDEFYIILAGSLFFLGLTISAMNCGAGGFIGSHLVNRLKSEGFWVRGVDLK